MWPMRNVLKRIQDWYETNCDDDWEHSYGVVIETLDNPGWAVRVDLADTYLETVEFQPVEYQNEDEDDWINCKKSETKFEGFGGPQKLEELLRIFLAWAEKYVR